MSSPPSKPIKETPLGTWLKQSRNARGLSVNGFAAHAGISNAHVSKIEAGKSGAKADMIERLVRALVPADLEGDEADESYRRLLAEGLKAAGFASDEYQYPTDRSPLGDIIREKGYNPDVLNDDESAMLDSGIEGLIEGVMRRKGQSSDK